MILTNEDVKTFCRVIEVIKEDDKEKNITNSIQDVQGALAKVVPTVAIAKKKSTI